MYPSHGLTIHSHPNPIPGDPAIRKEMHGANKRVLCCPVSLHNRWINNRRPSSDLCIDSFPIHWNESKYKRNYRCANISQGFQTNHGYGVYFGDILQNFQFIIIFIMSNHFSLFSFLPVSMFYPSHCTAGKVVYNPWWHCSYPPTRQKSKSQLSKPHRSAK